MRVVRRGATWLAMVALAAAAGCSRSKALTPEESAAKGDTLLRRMSASLTAAQTFSFSGEERREQVHANGEKREDRFTRKIVVRRPNLVTFTDSGGDRNGTAWYDGAHLTVVSHRAKAWARGPMPPTLDEAMDYVSKEYALQVPIADLLYSSPYDALMTKDTKGGWVDVQTVGGRSCDHLAYQHPAVDWEIWLSQDQKALPCQLRITYKNDFGKPSTLVTFSDWNEAPAVTAATFTPTVPPDYQRIRMIRHAAVADNAAAIATPAKAAGR